MSDTPMQPNTQSDEQPGPNPYVNSTESAGSAQGTTPHAGGYGGNPMMPAHEELTAPQVPPWAGQYQAYPPLPPMGGGYFAPTPEPRKSRRGKALLLALALLLTLGIGVGGGVALESARANGGTAQIGNVSLGSTSSPSISVSTSTTALQADLEKVAQAVAPSVVKITSTGAGASEAIGSGDILTSNGYIVTNDHVVQGFSNFIVTLSNGTSYQAQIKGQDPQDDLAVVKINATNLRPITFSDSSKAKVGEFAIAVGNALGLPQSQTLGVVSAVNQSASEAPNGPASELTGLIQTTAPINPGNSGGALVNLEGQLIGIPTLEATDPETGSAANGVGYAIAANRVQYIAQQLMKNGQVTSTGQGFLGIEAQDVTPQIAAADGLSVQSGVLVGGFANDSAGVSPAQQAGLKAGDVITAVNGHAVSSGSDLSGILLNSKPGSKVTLSIVRGSGQMTITVTLGERPVSAQG